MLLSNILGTLIALWMYKKTDLDTLDLVKV